MKKKKLKLGMTAQPKKVEEKENFKLFLEILGWIVGHVFTENQLTKDVNELLKSTL